MKELALLLTLVPALSACASTGDAAAAGDPESAASLAHDLVREAELRTDLRAMRAEVEGVFETSNEDPDSEDPLAEELETELLVALSEEIHVFGPGLEEEDAGVVHKTTHVVVGEYVRRGDDVLLAAILIDMETRVIVAAQRAVIPLDSLSDRARREANEPDLELRPLPWNRPPSEPALTRAAEPDATVAQAAPPEPEPSLTRVPAQSDPGAVEDFATWKSRHVTGRQVEPVQGSKTPWRTPELARLLGVPGPSGAYESAADPEAPWRTDQLQELLEVPPRP